MIVADKDIFQKQTCHLDVPDKRREPYRQGSQPSSTFVLGPRRPGTQVTTLWHSSLLATGALECPSGELACSTAGATVRVGVQLAAAVVRAAPRPSRALLAAGAALVCAFWAGRGTPPAAHCGAVAVRRTL